MTDPSPFSIALRNLRGAKPVDPVAHAANKSARTIHNYESGATLPTWRTVQAIARHLKRDAEPLRPLWNAASEAVYMARLARKLEKNPPRPLLPS